MTPLRTTHPLFARYEQELAYYQADAPFLTVDKCAERCVMLSLLLTQARLDATVPHAPFTDFPISRSL